MMFAITPVLALICTFIIMLQIKGRDDWMLCLIRSFPLVGYFAIGTLEILSLFHGINRTNLSIAWLAYIAVSIGFLIYKYQTRGSLRIPGLSLRMNRLEITGFLTIGSIMLLTLVVAWYAPPQTWDSLNYRMSRVAHWAQNQSLRPFATGISIQNTHPSGAELLFLHTYVLASGDRLVNLVQWFAMVGSIVGASFLARLFGGERSRILLTAVFAVTLPMGIIQASSTMNDYLVALWVTCFVVEVILFTSSRGSSESIAIMAMSFGLAFLTKPTAATFLFPFVIWVISAALMSGIWKTKIRQALIGLLLILILNLPHYSRTYQIFGQFFDPNMINTHANLARSIPGLTSNTLRNFSLHMGTPSPHVNKAINLTIRQIHEWIGIPINDPRTTTHADFRIISPTTNEIKAGNPLHMYSYIAALLLILLKRKEYTKKFLIYVGLTFSTMLVFSFIFKWQSFASRYHMPFFILISPIVGSVISKTASQLSKWLYIIIFFIASVPWLFSIQSRPIIPRESTRSSILLESREEFYFGDFPSLLKPYEQITNIIKSKNCRSVGIAIAGHSAEYPIWVFMGAPDDELEIEWIVGGSASSKFRDQSFSSCAIICDHSCPEDWEEVNGLPLTYQDSGYRLYIED